MPRGFRHAARTAETASLHLTVGMLTRNWNDLLREVVELATEEAWFRESLPVGFAADPAALEASLADRVEELRRFLDKVDLGQGGRPGRPPLLGRPAAAARRASCGPCSRLEELGDDTTSGAAPGPPGGCGSPAGGCRLLLGDRTLTMPAALEPAVRRLLDADRCTPADLAGHLDGPSRLVLARRLVREGLLQPTAVG